MKNAQSTRKISQSIKSTETNGDGVLTHSLRAGVVDALAIAPPHHLSLMNLGFHALAGPQDVRRVRPLSGIAAANRLLKAACDQTDEQGSAQIASICF
jgi:hypothetical protein